VARIIILDSGPLGLAARRPGLAQVQQCLAWLNALDQAGATIAIPEIADFEVRRELLRARITSGIGRLDRLKAQSLYLPITTAAMLRAAEFWADVRQRGVPTASPDALDADCILAGMAATALDPGDTVTIATNNMIHLGRFPPPSAHLARIPRRKSLW
jgi:predicted nucleic acid-binding protein